MARHVGCCQRFLAFRAKEMCALKIPLLVFFVEYVKSEQFFLWLALGCSNFLLSCARVGVIFYCWVCFQCAQPVHADEVHRRLYVFFGNIYMYQIFFWKTMSFLFARASVDCVFCCHYLSMYCIRLFSCTFFYLLFC